MSRTFRSILRIAFVFPLVCTAAFAQWQPASASASHAHTFYSAAPVYGNGGLYAGGSGNLIFGGSGLDFASNSPLDAPPSDWWASPYPSENPCQAGCNPNAGYEWDSVGALILDTDPPNARVTLDGIYAGTTDKLGPFQLPVGEHTLHIEAAGFELSDIIVKFEQPGVQSLNVKLKRLTATAKPVPGRQ
jgi:hypothetical protein